MRDRSILKISDVVLALLRGQMVTNMKETGAKTVLMSLVLTPGMTDESTSVIGILVKNKVLVLTYGLIVENTKATGIMIKCTGSGHFYGSVDPSTQVIMWRAREKEEEQCISGTEDNLKVNS
jgi:hypothetical protein